MPRPIGSEHSSTSPGPSAHSRAAWARRADEASGAEGTCMEGSTRISMREASMKADSCRTWHGELERAIGMPAASPGCRSATHCPGVVNRSYHRGSSSRSWLGVFPNFRPERCFTESATLSTCGAKGEGAGGQGPAARPRRLPDPPGRRARAAGNPREGGPARLGLGAGGAGAGAGRTRRRALPLAEAGAFFTTVASRQPVASRWYMAAVRPAW